MSKPLIYDTIYPVSSIGGSRDIDKHPVIKKLFWPIVDQTESPITPAINQVCNNILDEVRETTRDR